MEEWRAWLAKPSVDHEEVARYQRQFSHKYGAGLLALQCYPAELKTTEEMQRPIGIVCGPIEPALASKKVTDTLLSALKNYRRKGKRVVLLARGGRYARRTFAVQSEVSTNTILKDGFGVVSRVKADDKLPLVNDAELASRLAGEGMIVIAMGATGCKPATMRSGLFMLPYLDFDYSALMPHVDLVIHHGGAGTTIAALKAGVPQLIIPNANDCTDQLHHAARIETMGCGRCLAPHAPFRSKTNKVDETAHAVSGILTELPKMQQSCREWQTKLVDNATVEGVPVAVDTLRRLIASVVMHRARPRHEGPVCQLRPRSAE